MSTSPVYATDHSASVVRNHGSRTPQNSAPHLLPFLTPASTILDIGCGPGSISVGLARLVPQGHVTAVDYSDEPVRQTRELAEREGVGNLSAEVGDVLDLKGYKDGEFDVVHCHQVLQHVGDPVRALREMKRVVKKGGGVVSLRETAGMAWYPPSKVMVRMWEVHETVSRARGGDPHPGAKLHVWAAEAGFDRGLMRKGAGSWCYASEEERELLGGTWAGRVVESKFAGSAVEAEAATEEELHEMAAGWREWARSEDGWFAFWHGELLCFT